MTEEATLKIDYATQRRAAKLRTFLTALADTEQDASRAAKLRSAAWLMGNIEFARMIPREEAYFCPRCQAPMKREGIVLQCTSCFYIMYIHRASRIARDLRSRIGQFANAHDGMYHLLEEAADLIDVLADESLPEEYKTDG